MIVPMIHGLSTEHMYLPSALQLAVSSSLTLLIHWTLVMVINLPGLTSCSYVTLLCLNATIARRSPGYHVI